MRSVENSERLQSSAQVLDSGIRLASEFKHLKPPSEKDLQDKANLRSNMNFPKHGREDRLKQVVCCTSGCAVWPQLAPAGKHAASAGGQHDRLELEMSQCQCIMRCTNSKENIVKTTLQTCKTIRGTSLLEVPNAPSFAQDGHSLQALLHLRLSDKHGSGLSQCGIIAKVLRLLVSLREKPNLQTKARKEILKHERTQAHPYEPTSPASNLLKPSLPPFGDTGAHVPYSAANFRSSVAPELGCDGRP